MSTYCKNVRILAINHGRGRQINALLSSITKKIKNKWVAIIKIIIMYTYHALIGDALSTHMIYINLSTIFYIQVEHGPTVKNCCNWRIIWKAAFKKKNFLLVCVRVSGCACSSVLMLTIVSCLCCWQDDKIQLLSNLKLTNYVCVSQSFDVKYYADCLD